MSEIAVRKHFLRVVYNRTFRHLAAALAVCAVIAALCGGRLYFVRALCVAGMAFIAWGWFAYLHMTGLRVFGFSTGRRRRPVPYMHRRDKQATPHRPAFRKDFRDFDDDLTSATVVDETALTARQADIARVLGRVACGPLLIVLSFIV